MHGCYKYLLNPFATVTRQLLSIAGLFARVVCVRLQADLAKKREAELLKVKKDMELILVQSESNEASLRKRNQDIINELNDQVEMLTRSKSK